MVGLLPDQQIALIWIVWRHGAFTTLPFPAGAIDVLPLGMNNGGTIVGVYYDLQSTHGFLYSQGAFAVLNPPGSDSSQAAAINDSGHIVGEIKRR